MGNVEKLASVSFILIVGLLMVVSVFFKSLAAIAVMFALVFLYFVYILRKQEMKRNSNVTKTITESINFEDDSMMLSKQQSKREDVVIVIVFVICLMVGIMVALSIDPHEVMHVNCVFSC